MGCIFMVMLQHEQGSLSLQSYLGRMDVGALEPEMRFITYVVMRHVRAKRTYICTIQL